MDDHIRKLDTKIQSKETELNALYTKIQNWKYPKKLETVEMSLTGVLGAIFETEEEEEKE